MAENFANKSDSIKQKSMARHTENAKQNDLFFAKITLTKQLSKQEKTKIELSKFKKQRVVNFCKKRHEKLKM